MSLYCKGSLGIFIKMYKFCSNNKYWNKVKLEKIHKLWDSIKGEQDHQKT